MAYKFSIGQYRHSGSMVAEEGLTVDAGGLTVTSGSVALPAGQINTAEIADAAVTTIKIADLNVTVGKLAADAVETAKIKDLAVTNDKLAGSIASTKIAELNAFDTADLAENATNKYFTDARARAAVSVNDVSGDGSLTYDSGSGVITYTGPSASEVRAHLSAGDGLSFAGGQFAVTSSIAGAGLAFAAGVLSVDTAEIAAGLSGSVEAIIGAFVEGSDFVTFNDASGTIGVSAAAFTASADAAFDARLAVKSTTNLAEGTNLYYTDARARAAVSIVDAGGDGSFTYNSGSGVFTYTGPSASEVRAHFSAVDTNSIDMSYNSASGTIQGVLRLSGSALEVTSEGLRIASAAAGAGLDWLAGGALAVLVTGAVAVKNDKVSITGSVAGPGLAFLADGFGSVTQLSIAGGGVTNAMLSGGISNDKLVNNSVTVTAGAALAGGGAVALGSSVTLDVAVNSDALEIAADQVKLKTTIAGDRNFLGTVTINNLNVTGTLTTINTTNLEVVDARILIASGSSAFTASQGIDFGAYASLLTAEVNIDGVGGNEQVLSSSLPLVAPSMKAGTFYGALVGTMQEGIQTASSAATATEAIVLCNAASAGFTLTLPAASGWNGKVLKVKKSEGSANGVTVAASGSQTIDGVASIVLESPYAAVMLASDGSNWFVF